MSWFAARFGIGIGALLAGAFVGYQVGGPVAAWLSGLGAGFVAFASIVARDAVRAERLLDWWRDPIGTAPRNAGRWGEMAYLGERALRGQARAAAAERERLAQFLSAMEASPNGVLLLDAADHIEWCNARAADHFGLDPQRDQQQRVTNLIRAPEFVAYLQGGDFERPVMLQPQHGKGTLSVLVRRYAGNARLVLSQDLTERERSEAMRRDFVANVSHEIRTPLTVLSGFLETLRSLDLDAAERKRVVSLMSEQADRMSALVADLLTLAQLEGSPRPAADQWLAVTALVRAAEGEARGLSAGRHTITAQDVGGAQIAGSETELRSALSNVLNNAVRYTPQGGHIELGWQILADGRAEFSVSDNGRGVAREHLPRLTERFYRIDASRSRDTGGTGLGLAIVKHVVERHGGELVVESEVGKGSRFGIRLPAARVRPTAGAVAGALVVDLPSED